MNQEKTGAFLKTLRKEKDLTQEQLAEQFNVSGRSVSRWETGRNMPDLSILVELAEFYDVDIREIIDGERRSENMEKELKESLLKVAEYADNEKSNLAKSMCAISFLGLFGMIAHMIMQEMETIQGIPVFDFLRGMGFGLSFGALIAMILYTTGILYKIGDYKEGKKKRMVIVAMIVVGALFICSIVASL